MTGYDCPGCGRGQSARRDARARARMKVRRQAGGGTTMVTVLRMVTGVFALLARSLGRRGVAATLSRATGREAGIETPAERGTPRKLRLRRAAAWHGRTAERCRADGDEDGRRRHAAHAERYLGESRGLKERGSEGTRAGRVPEVGPPALCEVVPPRPVRDGDAADPPADGAWVTGAGIRVRPADMSDGHLANTIRYIRKKADSRRAPRWIGGKLRVYRMMLREADRRGLKHG